MSEVGKLIARQQRFVLWRVDVVDGRVTKVPYCDANTKASATKPSTWLSYKTAKTKLEGSSTLYDGIGIVLGELEGIHLAGIDIDAHGEAAENEHADAVMQMFQGTYMERSPSGKGVHILFVLNDERTGTLYDADGKFAFKRRNDDYGLEAYTDGRYFTLTGKRLSDDGIEDMTEAFKAFCLKYMRRDPKPVPSSSSATQKQGGEGAIPFTTCHLTHSEIDERINKARQASAEFEALYDRGDMSTASNNWSVADMKLCNMLAFWLDKDHFAIDLAFRRSKLYRLKWDQVHDGKNTYGYMTITKAIADTANVYDPRYNSHV